VAHRSRESATLPRLTGGDDFDELLRRWDESRRLSRTRRSAPPPPPRRRTRLRVVVLASLVAIGVLAATGPHFGGELAPDVYPAGARSPVAPGTDPAPVPAAAPSAAAMRRAWRFARRRGGQVSIAVVDTHGRLRGRDAHRRYPSASVVKALLLAAELRRLHDASLPLDETTAGLLKAMTVESDNDSADAIYARVGDPGLHAVAKRAGLRRFEVTASWGYAQITAADMARFFSRVREVLPRPHRWTGMNLLASIAPEQRWGIPKAAGRDWKVHFKGGWRETGAGELVHQAALLRGGGRTMAIAILTDAQPSRAYAIHTVRGVADRLLAARAR
jgi:beta-lactamase class A